MASSIFFTGIVTAQVSRPTPQHGEKGLKFTEQILTPLSLPQWLWAGAHTLETVQRRYRSVDGELLEKYLHSIPASGLNDPQNLLNESQRIKLEALIATHDMKSALPLYVNILAHGQHLLIETPQKKEEISRTFKNKNALIIFYYYGNSRGVNGYILLDKRGFSEDWEVDELFLKSAQHASIQVEKFAEIESFITELSKRSYWIEKKLINPLKVKKNESLKTEALKKDSKLDELLQTLNGHKTTFAAVLCSLLLAGWYYLWSSKWRKYVLPDSNTSTRLGADHGANISDTVEFSNPKASLADQYERIKNRDL